MKTTTRTAVLLTALAVFIGTQLLARASGRTLDLTDIIAVLIGTAIMFWFLLLRQHGTQRGWRSFWRGNRRNTEQTTQHGAQRGSNRGLLANPPLVVMPLTLVLFTLIPALERQGFGYAVMAVRMTIGVLIVFLSREIAPTWLALVSIITIVFHEWNHPATVTVTFIGLSLLTLGLNNLTSSVSASSPRVESPKLAFRSSAPVPIPNDSRSRLWSMISVIVIALIGGLLLAPTAKHWALHPNRSGPSGFNPSGLGNGDQAPTSSFTGLTRSKDMSLAYRPTRSNAEVLQVLTYAEAPVFLRAQTFDTWTGRTWVQHVIPTAEAYSRTALWRIRPSGRVKTESFLASESYSPLDATFRWTRTYIHAKARLGDVIPVPIEPFAGIWSLDEEFNGERPVDWFSDGTAAAKISGPTNYVVLHQPSTSAAVDTTRTDLLGIEKFSPRVRALANTIVGDSVTADDKTFKIRAWVTANIRYNITAQDPGRGRDPVDFLLFTAKEGSCTHFATATAALLRSVGVPARISTGFVAQEQVHPSEFIVRGRDAHAWAEVPLVGGGWRQIDTTLGAQEVTDRSTSPAVAWFAIGLTALLIGLAALVAALRHFRFRSTLASPTFRLLQRTGERVGIPITNVLSLRELAARLDSILAINAETGEPSEHWTHGPLTLFGAQCEEAAYGGGPMVDSSTLLRQADRRATQFRREERVAQRRAARVRMAQRIRGLFRRNVSNESPPSSPTSLNQSG